MIRVEREWFQTEAAFKFARSCVEDLPRGVDWREHVAWRSGYDTAGELIAWGCDPDLADSEAEVVEGLG